MHFDSERRSSSIKNEASSLKKNMKLLFIVIFYLHSDIREMTPKICVPGWLITQCWDNRDLTFKKWRPEVIKVVSTISAVQVSVT